MDLHRQVLDVGAVLGWHKAKQVLKEGLTVDQHVREAKEGQDAGDDERRQHATRHPEQQRQASEHNPLRHAGAEDHPSVYVPRSAWARSRYAPVMTQAALRSAVTVRDVEGADELRACQDL